MLPLTDIPAPVADAMAVVAAALARVETRFESTLASDLPPVQRLVEHLESYRGKMLRPALVVLSGLAASGRRDTDVSEDHITIAAVCEMIHMATLVHDDVLDEADVRRKGATVNRLRGNEMAVILGDYLFSSAYRLCASLPDPVPARRIGETGMTLCSGELLQLHHRENFSLDEPTYFAIVQRKTGSLIGVACELGARQSGADPTLAARLYDFGLTLGVAFQIQDDVLDLTGNQSVVGKPLRRDLELGKLTLPVIHHLANATPKQRGAALALLENASRADDAAIASLVEELNRTGSIQHAKDRASELVRRSKSLIDELPESGAKGMLMVMADQVVTRSA